MKEPGNTIRKFAGIAPESRRAADIDRACDTTPLQVEGPLIGTDNQLDEFAIHRLGQDDINRTEATSSVVRQRLCNCATQQRASGGLVQPLSFQGGPRDRIDARSRHPVSDDIRQTSPMVRKFAGIAPES